MLVVREDEGAVGVGGEGAGTAGRWSSRVCMRLQGEGWCCRNWGCMGCMDIG